MGLLFPLYLLGALALAIPVLLHLRRRPPKDRVVFSSLMFLDPQTPQRKRRNKLENLILLALRCLALLLLALLFSRPFFRDPDALAGANQGTVRVVLVDRSASMQRGGMWEAAVEQAKTVLTSAKPEDQLALLAFDATTETLLGFDQWRELPPISRQAAARENLEKSGAGWRKTALDAALIESIGLIEDETKGAAGEKEIVLISDLQDGATRTGLDNFAWPEDVELRLNQLTPENAGNAAAHLVARAENEDEEEESETAALRIRVTNAASSETEAFTLAWDGDPKNAVDVRLPAGATRVVVAPPRPAPTSQFLELRGDSEMFDNRVYVAPPEARPVQVLYVGGRIDAGDTNSPLFYLQRALSPTATLAPTLKWATPAELTQNQVRTADVIVLATQPKPTQNPWLTEFLRDGGLVLLALWEGGDTPELLDAAGIRLREAEIDDYAMLEKIDFEHPVLRPFSAPGLRDFTKIHFWRYRSLELPDPAPETVRVMASFDSGDPAWLEIRVERGRIFLFTSNWVPQESQLALSSKFVPLIYSMMRAAGFESDARRQFYAGDPVPIPTPEAEVTHPDKTTSTGPSTADLPGVLHHPPRRRNADLRGKRPFRGKPAGAVVARGFRHPRHHVGG